MIPAPCCHEVIYNNTDNAGDSCSGSEDVYNDRLPYCDQDNSDACFDSKDYDQETGLYPCMDGSQVGDYRDCPDRESNNDDEDTAAEDDLP